MGILDAPVRPRFTPYASSTRPWFLDLAWPFCKSWGFDGVASINVTTLANPVTQYTNTAVLTNVAGLAVGELYVIGQGTQAETVVIETISTNTITFWPKCGLAHASGEVAGQFWTNDTHPTATGYNALGYAVAYAKQRLSLVGSVLWVNGLINSYYTDANAKTNVPVGWESIGTAAFSQAAYVNTSRQPNARKEGASATFSGGFFSVATGVQDGVRSLDSIKVTAGQVITVRAHVKTTSGIPEMLVVDKATPATILAGPVQIGANTGNLWGSSSSAQSLGVPTTASFVVPSGVTDIEIRFRGYVTGASNCYFDDVRVIASRQAPGDDRYVIEHPVDRSIVVLGDSWTVGGFADFQTALQARLGTDFPIINAGISGQRLDQMVARFSTDVAPYNPAYCIHYSGWANDLSQARTQAQIEADTDAFIAACRARGITPVILGPFPVASVRDTALDRNNQVRARCDLAATVSAQ